MAAQFDPLDMNNYKVEKLPKIQKSKVERWMARLGGPLAIIAFIVINWCCHIGFIDNLHAVSPAEKIATQIDTAASRHFKIEAACVDSASVVVSPAVRKLAAKAVSFAVKDKTDSLIKYSSAYKELSPEDQSAFHIVFAEEKQKAVQTYIDYAKYQKKSNLDSDEGFIEANYAMLAIFVASIILWITEAIPNYLTSLLVILSIVLCNVTPMKTALNQLGHPVMWLNILSFVLASMLVKTRFAKRMALAFVIKFGKTAKGVLWSFLVINIILSLFISATTVKATIMLPIFMVVCAIYGASNGNRNNFGRNLVIQNLFQVNIGANAFYTGSGAHLLAISLIAGVYSGCDFGYSDWLLSCGPMSFVLLILGLVLGMYVFFPMKKEEQVPQIEGGLERLKDELRAMGKITSEEIKAVAIFVLVLVLWVTKGTFHDMDETIVALLGAVIALTPKIGVVKWNDVDIPWHLMLFSAGAYTLGSGLNATDLPNTMVNAGFDSLGITSSTPYWVLYVVLTALMVFSGLLFQSKTIRTMVFVPIATGVEQRFGFPPLSLALPVAMLIEHVYVLPFNSKPAALLYNTNQYSQTDAFKFGFTMMVIAWLLILVWGQTFFKWAEITPGLF